MKSCRLLLTSLALVLLLLQVPMMGLSFAAGSDSTGPMLMDGAADSHHCQGAAAQTSSCCQDNGCVFCGLLTLPETPQVSAYVAHQLFVLTVIRPLQVRFEQSVELRPPKNSLTA